MTVFVYRDGILHAEDVAVPAIAAAVGTPFYCYSHGAMVAKYREFEEAFAGMDAMVCYAMKANSNQAVIKTFADLGAGADVVSVGEMDRAITAGVSADRIVFAGVGKTRVEMARAIDAGIFQFNVESVPELETLSAVATGKNAVANVAIRVNPDVDANTHAHITTGRKEDKFGIPWDRALDVYDLAGTLPGLNVTSIALHIGSQLTELAPLEAAFVRVVGLIKDLRARGYNISHFDLGGGLGIVYDDEKPMTVKAYADMVRRVTADIDVRLVCEPGRVMVGNAGILVTSVVYVKDEARRFVILDGAMNDLIRPALYQAHHHFEPVLQAKPNAIWDEVDLVGPICESTDRFAEKRLMPPLAPDDLIAVRSAGAYCAVMASTYNSRPLIPEVMVRGKQFAVVRERIEIEDLIAREPIPTWL
jgi:diaminopimelate decarboxylase